MKKILIFLVVAISLASCSQYDDVALWNKTMNINSRLLTLEELCEQMNTNITSLQTVVNALQENDYITSVNPVYNGNEIVGYTISFFKSESITIYHGLNGEKGEDGYTPVIGVKLDVDGIYYWTLDGTWLLDEVGNKIRAEGRDGQNGQDGANGKYGITPKFKIENGDWYVSTDNGQTWENIGRATGENGKDGKDGSVGDSMFSNIDTSNSEYVIFTLVDGTVIKIPTWYAFEELMKLCNEMNTNITSLQKIVEALQENDYITGVTPLFENGTQIGYTITFKKSGPIVIYHGKDGMDGKDGYSPKIGVAKDADGIYYWTLDGEWLLDDNGNKIKAEGKDGKDGNDGSSGEAGSGKDGEDGITPELKIEDGYWYVSYDNGETWRKLGKATGENGKDGQPGENGDSFFKNVDTSNPDYIIFVLVDGTEIKIPTWYAFEELKKICNEMNTNIKSLQTIIEAMETGDYIVSCTPLMENGKQIGYTITFAKGGSIVIYHGKDGQDGTDGTSGSNGENGHTPQIGAKQDVDGNYYWTIDGEWLTDESGAKIPVTGKDGQAGSKGEDGITPQLKIEDGYWYVSYDGGQQWQKLGKATGEDGKDGLPGEGGDSIFKSIDTSNPDYVIITLEDGTEIKLSYYSLLDITFDEDKVVDGIVGMESNSTLEVGYVITGNTDNLSIDVVASGEVKAIVASRTATEGNIVITTGSSIDEFTRVVVLVSNGARTIMRSLTFNSSSSSSGQDFVETAGGINFPMIFVEGGTFKMGATEEQGSDAQENEKPVHNVTLSSYYIGKYEVTGALWEAVTGWRPNQYGTYVKDNEPVYWVDWNDIQIFLTELKAKTGKKYRLPTEAEWEYAARGGNKSKGYKYSGSDNLNDVGWSSNNRGDIPYHPVGSRLPNELGIYDMSGNMGEACSDWYGNYTSEDAINPTGPSSGSEHVVRGGYCFTRDYNCRVSWRSGWNGSRANCYGLRIVLEL